MIVFAASCKDYTIQSEKTQWEGMKKTGLMLFALNMNCVTCAERSLQFLPFAQSFLCAAAEYEDN